MQGRLRRKALHQRGIGTCRRGEHAGIKHSLHAAYDALLRVHASLDRIIEHAHGPSWHNDKSGRPDFSGIYKFPFEFVDEADGKLYNCQMGVRENRGPNGISALMFYDLNVIVV